MVKPLGARQPPASLPSRLHRAITPSDSGGSLAGEWMMAPAGGSNDLETEDEDVDVGETEAVLVTVR